MKKILYFLLAMALGATSILSCQSCYSAVHAPKVDSSMLFNAPLAEDRDINKARVLYMRERLVSVRRDCELKEEVSIVKTTKDKLVVATLDAGTEHEQIIIVGKNPSTLLDGRGTGTILRSYKDSSYISTAEHVINFSSDDREKGLHKIFDCTIFIQLDEDANTSDNRMEVEVIAEDESMDLAILKIEKNLNISSELIDDPFPGEVIWSSGYPGDRADRDNVHLSVTKGTLATLYVPHMGHKAHRVTSQIFSGNSGGPIWNEEGKLVGVVLFMFGHRNYDGSFTPYEGAYYIRPVSSIVEMSIQNRVYSEVFREQ